MERKHTQKSSTVASFAYLFLAFPLGLCYFLITVIGLAVGFGTVVIWIGLPLLFATLIAVRAMADIERNIAANLLHISFPQRPVPFSRYGTQDQRFMQRFGNYLSDPLTWTSVIYMLLKLPLGIISFTLVLVLPIVASAVTLLPVAYLVNLFVNAILLKNGIHSESMLIPYFLEVHATFDLTMFVRSFVGVPVGLVLWVVTRYVLNGLALISGEVARALLSPIGADTYPPVRSEQRYAAPLTMEDNAQLYAAEAPLSFQHQERV